MLLHNSNFWNFLTSEIICILCGFHVFSWEVPTVSYSPCKAELLLLSFRSLLSFPIVFGHTEYTGSREQSEKIFSYFFPEFNSPNLMFAAETWKGKNMTVFLKLDFTLSEKWTGVSFVVSEGRLIDQHCASRKVLLEKWRVCIAWT